MNEAFYAAARYGIRYLPYLSQAQFACQHQPLEPERGQPAGLLHCADIALGGGMQLYGRNLHGHQPEVLDDEGVAAGFHSA